MGFLTTLIPSSPTKMAKKPPPKKARLVKSLVAHGNHHVFLQCGATKRDVNVGL